MMRSAWHYTLLAAGGLLFALICLTWAVAATALRPLLPREAGRRVGRRAAMAGFRAFLAPMELAGALRLDLRELEALKSAGPLIVAPNHPGLLDAVLLVSRMPEAVCVMKGNLLDNFLLAPAARLAGYVPNDSLRRLVRRARAELHQGGQLLLFPEGTRSLGTPVGPLTEAVGAISRAAGVPVQVVLIEASAPFLGKRPAPAGAPAFPIVYRVRLGRRFDPPQDVRAFTQELERHFRRELGHAAPEAASVEAAAVPEVQQLRG